MNQIELEVIAPVLDSFDGCPQCQFYLDSAGIGGQVVRSGLETPEVRAEYLALSRFLTDLGARYGETLIIRVVDPGSVRGLWKSMRHRVRSYPTFILDDEERFTGLATGKIEAAVRSHLTARYRRARPD